MSSEDIDGRIAAQQEVQEFTAFMSQEFPSITAAFRTIEHAGICELQRLLMEQGDISSPELTEWVYATKKQMMRTVVGSRMALRHGADSN